MKNTYIIGIVLIAIVLVIIIFAYMPIRPVGNTEPIVPAGSEKITDTTTKTSSPAPSTTQKPKASEVQVKTVETVSSSPSVAPDGAYVVEYTNTGFVPQTLQIPRGKSVRFINKSGRALRIFSDNTVDPKFTELNQSTTIGKGGTYTLSLVNSGVWAYHNQLYPADTGNVTVF